MAGGSKRRRQQRVKAVGEEVEASIRQDAEDKKLQHVEAEQLFQVDSKGGAAPPLTKKQKMLQLQKDPVIQSRKFRSGKANKGEEAAVKKMKAALQTPAAPQKTVTAAKKGVDGLWGGDGNAKGPVEEEELDEYVAPAVIKKVSRRKLTPSTKYKVPTVEVAAAGQSYHPDFDTHQDVMAEAVAQVLERREIVAKMAEPVSAGLSEETLQYIKTGSSPRKLPAKVTRTQRNKRERHKHMEMEHKARRGEKSIVKQINTANHILQDIVKTEKKSAQKQQLKKLQLEQKLQQEPLVRVAGKFTKLVRDTPVAFSEDLTGNMRTLKPKGHPMLERFDSLHKRNQIEIGRPRKTHKRKNFRHDMRGAQVVEIRREEYERTKRSILKKIRRRLVILGVIIGLLSIISFILASVIRGYHANVAKFQQVLGRVSLRDLYFIYAATSLFFSFHGFYIDGKWRKMQLDGNRLILHVRVFFALGVASWAIGKERPLVP
ncbi:hypothetical protein BBJ28_00000175 [Nothophytophthora sp. Chile5]|nr:hypothetical protein BBJ28_00000175 [Nothophytophthora sp. Chile5]